MPDDGNRMPRIRQGRSIPARGGSHSRGRGRNRLDSPRSQLQGTGRVLPFRRPHRRGDSPELEPRQSRLAVIILVALVVAALAVGMAMAHRRTAGPSNRILLSASGFQAGTPLWVPFSRYPRVHPAKGDGVYVVQSRGGTWRAFSDVPPDSACRLQWDGTAKVFRDPCTGARWAADGSPRAAGTAPLYRFAVSAAGGVVRVDVGQLAK